MKVYKSSLLVMIVSMWATSALVAGSVTSLIDFNRIEGIKGQGNNILIEVVGGTKTYNHSEGKWSYDVSSGPVMAPNYENFYSLSLGREDLPGWYPKYTYTDIIYKDNGHGLLLTANADEGAMGVNQFLVDTPNKRIYVLPFEQIRCFYLDGSNVWLGSGFGCSQIDLNTMTRIDYLTLPAVTKITGVTRFRDKVYFLDQHYGLFAYNGNDHKIEPIESVNGFLREKDMQVWALLKEDNVLFIVANQMGRTGSHLSRNNSQLIIYKPLTSEVETLDSGVGYVDHLTKMNSNVLGYGSFHEEYEGGESVEIGGAFLFDVEQKTFQVVSDKPIWELNSKADNIEAKSIYKQENTGSVILTELRYDNDKKQFAVINEQIVPYPRYKRDNVSEYQEKLKEYEKVEMLIYKTFKERFAEREKEFKELFKDCPVNYSTIPVNRGAIECRQY